MIALRVGFYQISVNTKSCDVLINENTDPLIVSEMVMNTVWLDARYLERKGEAPEESFCLHPR